MIDRVERLPPNVLRKSHPFTRAGVNWVESGFGLNWEAEKQVLAWDLYQNRMGKDEQIGKDRYQRLHHYTGSVNGRGVEAPNEL